MKSLPFFTSPFAAGAGVAGSALAFAFAFGSAFGFGFCFAAGSPVVLSLGAANRDSDRFTDADELQADRDAQGHVAFGHGLHHCIGAQLARIEGDVAVRYLLARFPDVEAAVPFEELVYRQSTLVRGVKTLPVKLRP